MKEANKLTTSGKFNDALGVFRRALQSIPISAANDAKDENQFLEMIDMCREYVNLCRLEVARKSLDPNNVARGVELVSYLTCCKVQPVHQLLTLQLAMSTSYKAQNYVTAASFAKRLLLGNLGNPDKVKDVMAKARQVVQLCEQKASDQHVIKFDPKAAVENFKLCAGSFTPVQPMDPTVLCPFCASTYHANWKGKLCDTCQLCEIGANTLGIQLRPI